MELLDRDEFSRAELSSLVDPRHAPGADKLQYLVARHIRHTPCRMRAPRRIGRHRRGWLNGCAFLESFRLPVERSIVLGGGTLRLHRSHRFFCDGDELAKLLSPPAILPLIDA